ncbi:MAG: cation transporter [Myxococcota bacterium]
MEALVEGGPGADWSRRARVLAGLTIGWNVVEGLVSMAFGFAEESVALFGFGLDSWVEVASAAVVWWKLTRPSGCATTRKSQERTATRWISALFLVLAGATTVGAIAQLTAGHHPASTLPSLVVSVVSLAMMGFLWRAKKAAAAALDSRTLEMDAACSLACIQLSAVLFTGSLLYLVLPDLWWADGLAALALSAFIGREGWEGWQAAKKADFAGGCGCGG